MNFTSKLETNYLKFNDGAGAGNTDTFAQQYLPELYEAEVERYGNRTLQGFLRMVGAEMPMSSDQVIWTEQNRLHIAYDGCTAKQGGVNTTIRVPLEAGKECMIRVGSTIVVSEGLVTLKARVTAVPANAGANHSDITVATYKVADLSLIHI